MTPLLQRYLNEVIKTCQSIDARGVMQVQRWVELNLDEIYVSLTVRLDREPASLLRPRSGIHLRIVGAPFGLFPMMFGGINQDKVTKEQEPSEARLDELLERERRLEPSEETGIALEELWRRNRNWVLLGDPGSGKTTVLKHLALKSTQACLAGNAAQLPIPVTLRFFAHAWGQHPEWTHERAIFAYLEDSGLSELGFEQPDDRCHLLQELRSALQNRQALLLLDGLDEQRDAALKQKTRLAVEGLLSEFPGNLCLISSRIIGYDAAPLGAEFQVATLEPFNEEQMGQFFRNWLYAVEKGEDIVVDEATRKRSERKAEELIEQVRNNPGVKQLASNPLLCTIIGLIHRQGGTLPQQRAELYKLCVDTFIFNWEMHKRRTGTAQEGLNKDETQAVLEEIALHFQEHCDENRAARAEIQKLVSQFLKQEQGMAEADVQRRAGHLLNLIREVAGLLIDRGEEEYGFFHLTFQEYLAARAITRRRKDIDRYLNAHLFDPRWREVILLAAAHQGLKDEESGSEFIEAILRHRHQHEEEMQYAFRIAFLCLREVRVEFELSDRLFARWVDLYLNRPYLRPLLLRLVVRPGLKLSYQSSTFQPLLAALKDRDRDPRWAAAEALGALKDPVAVPPLLAALKDDDIAPSLALGKIKDPASVVPLLQLLKDENPDVRHGALGALGMMKDPASLPFLLAALKDKETEVRREAAYALGEIKDPAAIPSLLAALQDEGCGVRMAAVQALGVIKDPAVLPALLRALKSKDSCVNSDAARALGKLKDPAVLPKLFEALKDKDANIRWRAIWALREFEDPVVLPSLYKAMSDDDPSVRVLAARTLGGLKEQAALPLLSAALNDKNGQVRREAAEALGNFKDPVARASLLEALKDVDEDVRWAASLALSTRNDPDAFPALLEFLRRKTLSTLSFRWKFAEVLRAIKKLVGLPNLFADRTDKCYFDKYNKVSERRVQAAHALGSLKDFPVLPPLLEALKDENDWVRQHAALTLRERKDPAALTDLVDALKDEEHLVRWAAADALGAIKDPIALPHLFEALKDKNPDVRCVAAQAIDLIEMGAAL